MVSRIEVDRSGYHLKPVQPTVQKQNEPVKASDNTIAARPAPKETAKAVEQNVKLTSRANEQKLAVQNTKTSEQAIDTYANYRKKQYEARIKTRFDLFI